MWSQKTRYAVRALIVLAENPGKPMSVREVADGYGIPHKYLEAIFGDLRTERIVRSTKGPRGGYLFDRSPEHISLEDVLRAVDREFLSNGSDDATADRAGRGVAAETDILKAVATPFYRRLTETSIADALHKWRSRRQIVDYVI